MTIQLKSPGVAKSKATLQAALNSNAKAVWFEDPSIFAGSRGIFTGDQIPAGDNFAIVMDPQTRMRFSTLLRRIDGTFKIT